MRHGVDGRYFGRNTSHRVAMLKNLGNNLIIHDQIITTIEKAKETRRVVERLITLAKKGTLNSRRISFDRTRDQEVVKKLFDELVPRYKDRKGGYTRIVKVSETRWGDAAKMAMIELVDHPKLDRKKKVKEVAAIGAPDEHSGEVVKVCIVKSDESLTEKEVIEFARLSLTNYKVPKKVVFMTDLPKTPVGKILRRALRDQNPS